MVEHILLTDRRKNHDPFFSENFHRFLRCSVSVICHWISGNLLPPPLHKELEHVSCPAAAPSVCMHASLTPFSKYQKYCSKCTDL